jgi:hypothetical protein
MTGSVWREERKIVSGGLVLLVLSGQGHRRTHTIN